MSKAQTEEKLAVEAGYWNNFRFDPRKAAEGKNPFTLDSKAPSADYKEFLMGEVRYASLAKANPNRAEALFDKSAAEAVAKYAYLQKLQKMYEPEE